MKEIGCFARYGLSVADCFSISSMFALGPPSSGRRSRSPPSPVLWIGASPTRSLLGSHSTQASALYRGLPSAQFKFSGSPNLKSDAIMPATSSGPSRASQWYRLATRDRPGGRTPRP